MRNNSLSCFHIYGAPELRFNGTKFTVHDSADGEKTLDDADFHIEPEFSERAERACEAFNAIMREGLVAPLVEKAA